MTPGRLRLVPFVFACTLLVAAASPPANHHGLGSGAGPAATAAITPCAGTIQAAGSTTPYGMAVTMGLTQPIVDGTAGIAGSSLDFGINGFSYGELDHAVVAWDPVAMAPDPTTVALRTSSFSLSAYYSIEPLTATYVPNLVRRQDPAVAEPLRGTLALDWYIPSWYATGTTHYDSTGAAQLPGALQYIGTGARTPLSGPHPVLTHDVCSGDSATNALSVVQGVVRCDSLTDATTTDLIQTFRVPVPTQLHWVEFAEAPTPIVNSNLLAILSIVDATTSGMPPVNPPEPMVQAYTAFFASGVPQWRTHLDFDHTITLLPAHDYWLFLHPNGSHRYYTRMRTGAESANFTSHIGSFWQRTPQDAGWVPVSDRVLDFRLVGEVLGTTGVPVGGPAEGRLQLRALTNPARGAVAFAWSGARSALRIEVLDVRGRRVAAGETAATPEGRWLWTASQPDGTPLPAGVYFIRASDARGSAASERVVLVR